MLAVPNNFTFSGVKKFFDTASPPKEIIFNTDKTDENESTPKDETNKNKSTRKKIVHSLQKCTIS